MTFDGLMLAAISAVPEDIRDIRAPIAIPPWWRWPVAIAACALVALGIVLVVRWVKRRGRALTPLERALEQLRIAEEHARAGRPHEWAEAVARTVRVALATRLGRAILPQTTSELARQEWAHWAYEGPVDAPHPAGGESLVDAPRIISLLETCDLARFACAPLDADALLGETARARELVERLFAPPPKAAASVFNAGLVSS